ncbi:hypothetical protein PCCS19_32290 [Paenibacillus sp. CCS19]|nr:hypothetical protein PCCS19_32290 [Paenibacillus cellulosilyticus]
MMGAYYAQHIQSSSLLNLVVEQGQEIGRDGRVEVAVTNGTEVEITGTAVYVGEFEVQI